MGKSLALTCLIAFLLLATTAARAGTIATDGKSIAEPARNIPVTHGADVVVIGAGDGGLGGVMAAVAAARQGAKVILIERGGHVGLHVPIALGVVIGIDGWKPTIHEGLFRDFAGYVARSGQWAAQPMTEEELLKKGEIIIRYHDVVSNASLAMLKDAGVQTMFHARVAGAVVDGGNQLKAVIVESPQGRHAVAGKAFVDSTALGEVAAAAGAPMSREEPFMSVQAFIGRVDETAYRAWLAKDAAPLDDSFKTWMVEQVGPFEKLGHPWNQWWPEYLGDRMPPAVVRQVRDAMSKGEFTLIRRRGESGVLAIVEGVKANGEVAMPRTYITGIDPLNIDDLNWAETESRLALGEFHAFLKKRVGGFEKSIIERMADVVSLRGGRFIKTDKPITPEEIQKGQVNPDCIYVFQRSQSDGPYEVPYRALVPDKIDGLLVVGKATAGGVHLRTAHGVLFQGQAAGVACAMAAKSGTSVREMDIAKLQAALRATGVRIPAHDPAKN